LPEDPSMGRTFLFRSTVKCTFQAVDSNFDTSFSGQNLLTDKRYTINTVTKGKWLVMFSPTMKKFYRVNPNAVTRFAAYLTEMCISYFKVWQSDGNFDTGGKWLF
jgi:hypothetical protein